MLVGSHEGHAQSRFFLEPCAQLILPPGGLVGILPQNGGAAGSFNDGLEGPPSRQEQFAVGLFLLLGFRIGGIRMRRHGQPKEFLLHVGVQNNGAAIIIITVNFFAAAVAFAIVVEQKTIAFFRRFGKAKNLKRIALFPFLLAKLVIFFLVGMEFGAGAAAGG